LTGTWRDLADELGGAIDERGVARPEVALVLGSGLGAFADSIEGGVAIEFGELPSMSRSTVPGHAGRFVLGEVEGVPVICQQGRVHLYEGHSAEVVTRAVRSFAGIGVRAVLLTNAAGGLVAEWPVPCLMRITDHVNLQGVTPLGRGEGRSGRVYDEGVGEALVEAGRVAGVELREGVYVGLSGPSYETAAEIRMLAGLPAHAVGMSTVLEALAAHAAGARVAAISLITNAAAGTTGEPLNHEEVVEAGREAACRFCGLLEAAVPHLARV